MVELGIPELSTDQIEALCSIAENAARKYVLSKVSSKMVDTLDVSVEAIGSKPVDVSVEVDLILASNAKNIKVKTVVDKAVVEAHKATEKYLRKIK